MHGAIHVEISPRDQLLGFHNEGERLSVHLALLHRKCTGQKLLEGFAIEAGMCTHVRGFWGLLLGWSWRVNRPNQLRSPATEVSHRFGCTVNTGSSCRKFMQLPPVTTVESGRLRAARRALRTGAAL